MGCRQRVSVCHGDLRWSKQRQPANADRNRRVVYDRRFYGIRAQRSAARSLRQRRMASWTTQSFESEAGIRRHHGPSGHAVRFDESLGLGPSSKSDYLEILVRSEEHTSELQSLMRISYAVF